ncbi:PD-(D/E)XK nuclease family protein, partial [Streptomyces sp. NPDC002172]
ALADYVRGHELETEGKRIKKLARAMLSTSPAGAYGANELAWGGESPKWAVDVQAMVDLHEDAEIPVPMVADEDRMVTNLKAAGLAVPEVKTSETTPKTIIVRPFKA